MTNIIFNFITFIFFLSYTSPVHFWLFGFLIGFWVDNYWLMKLCDLINNTNFQNNKKVVFFDHIFKNKQTENKTNAGWIKVEIFSISDLPYSIFDFDHVLGLVNGFLIKNPINQKWTGLLSVIVIMCGRSSNIVQSN